MPERVLRLESIFTAHPAVNQNHGIHTPQHGRNPIVQIPQRIPMLCEDDDFLARRGLGARDLTRAVRNSRFRDLAGHPAGGEDLAEEACKFSPLGVRAAATHAHRQCVQRCERLDLSVQFGDRPRRRGLVEDLFFGGLDFVLRSLVQVLDIVQIELGPGCDDCRSRLRRKDW